MGIFIFRLMHNTDEARIFYPVDPVQSRLALLQEEFIAIVRSTGNAMETGIPSKG